MSEAVRLKSTIILGSETQVCECLTDTGTNLFFFIYRTFLMATDFPVGQEMMARKKGNISFTFY